MQLYAVSKEDKATDKTPRGLSGEGEPCQPRELEGFLVARLRHRVLPDDSHLPLLGDCPGGVGVN